MKPDNPLVSVIIPTRNRQELLKRSLQSIYDQTYKNIEIIVVDDQSVDGTPDFLRAESKSRGIRFIRNEFPNGAGKARNIGIKEALGDIIAFQDDDDEWLPEKLEHQVAAFKRDPDVGLVYTGVELMKVDYGISYYSTPEIKGYIYKELLIENKIGGTITVAIRSEIVKELLFDETLPAREEYDLWLRVAKHHKIGGVKRPLARAYARNSLNRITSNIDNYEKGIQIINEKFKEDTMQLSKEEQRQRSAAQSLFLASQSLMAGSLRLSRKYFLKSLLQKPKLKSLGGFAASFLGPRTLFRLRKLKKIG